MHRQLGRDEVLRLAPDASSAKSGQELAQPRKWLSLGADEVALWGECQGSGAKPYQVQVDWTDLTSKCSCPSRKFPCKHALGLMLIAATDSQSVAVAAQPAWVNEWLTGRKARATKVAEKAARPPEPRDPAAAARRRAQRFERIRAGMSALADWTQDLARAGIASAPTRGFEFFDGQARRLVDAQAPGIARRVRQLGSCASQGAGWQRPFLERLSLLHLATCAVERYEQLTPTQQADVEAELGLTVEAEDLAGLAGVRDQWQVISREIEVDERISAQRSWLIGRSSRRAAMLLSFAHAAAPFDLVLPPGTQFDTELVFYPGSGARAALRGALPPGNRIESPAGMGTIAELLDAYASALGACPWIDRLGFLLQGVVPARLHESWCLIDRSGSGLPLRTSDSTAYLLVAVSGGGPIGVAVEFDGQQLRPLCLVDADEWVPLVSQSRESA